MSIARQEFWACKRKRRMMVEPSATARKLPRFKRKRHAKRDVMNKPQQKQHQQCEIVKFTFDDLPPEVLEMVLRFLPYSLVAGPVRLVSRKCSEVARTILNSAFLSAGWRLSASLKRADTQWRSLAPDQPERLVQGRLRDCLEVVQAQYSLLRACVWRYTHPAGTAKQPRLCFYGGAILDEFERILADAKLKPEDLLGKNTVVGPRLEQFALRCKLFMNHFEEVSEYRINKSSLVSGCKAADILDCLLVGREVLNFWVSGGQQANANSSDGIDSSSEGQRPTAVSMKLRYVLRRAWFTCLKAPWKGRREDSWRDRQRFMYLRLRRLVGIVNEHHLEERCYERELLALPKNCITLPRPPTCSQYSGYGECGGRFFYYGNMNDSAFNSKVIDTWRKNAQRNRELLRPQDRPNYDLVVNVELRCSPELAPLSVRSILKCDDFESASSSSKGRLQMYLKLSVFCPASLVNRLPSTFVWELRGPRRSRCR